MNHACLGFDPLIGIPVDPESSFHTGEHLRLERRRLIVALGSGPKDVGVEAADFLFAFEREVEGLRQLVEKHSVAAVLFRMLLKARRALVGRLSLASEARSILLLLLVLL